MDDEQDRNVIEDEYAKAMGALGHFAQAFTYIAPHDLEEYIEDVAKWSSALEALDADLSLTVLRESIRVISSVLPYWESILPYLA